MDSYLSTHSGELAALTTAFLWTITALVFESASVKVGSLPVNIIRLLMGFVLISIFSWFYRGMILPLDAEREVWVWLAISGIIGFTFGDFFLFKSYTLIGSRFSMLIMTLVPPLTAILGWFVLREKLSVMNIVGMTLTLTGIGLAIFNRKNGAGSKLSLKLAPKGILFAFFGALGQAGGLVTSKIGIGDYDPFAATQIRIVFGSIGFIIVIIAVKKILPVKKALKNKKAMINMGVGSFFGLLFGVSLSQYAIVHTETGIASTIMSMVPVLIIPPAVLLYKQKVTRLEAIGAIVSVTGVSLFFI